VTMIRLGAGDVLFLKGEQFDQEDLLAALAPLGLEAFLTTRAELAEQEVRRIVIEQGLSALWQTVILEEALLPRTPDVPALVAVLKEMLQRLAPKSEFIVVDRFLLPKPARRPGDYVDTLLEVLEPAVSQVHQLLVITAEDHDAQLRADLEQRLQALHPECRFQYRCSDKFHDRFWIADRDRGLFVGTSPNGLGRRYALADYLATDDVLEIVTALESEGLLG